MVDNDKTSLLGRKIFFLHPSARTQNQLIPVLAQEEFEVYTVKDEDKLQYGLKCYPDSILLASINETMKENAWEKYIKGIQENPETAAVDIGIIASTDNEDVRRKYTEQIKVSCGYTVIKSDYQAAIRQVTIILNNVNAKGRRKYIRMDMGKETNATVNLPLNGTFINGVIKDISVVGFSCAFAEDPGLKKNELFGDIQLRLPPQLLNVEGIVFGSHVDGNENVYVVLFTQRIDSSIRSRIRTYIQTSLQSRMDEELR